MTARTIAITGVAGFFSRALLPLLESDPTIERVIGIDISQPSDLESYSKVEFHQMDIRDEGLTELLDGVDCLLHLGFILMRLPGAKAVDDINIHGTQSVIHAAGEKGIPKLIVTGSVVGYGLHADNPVPLTEESPLRPNLNLYYSRAKAANAAFLDEFTKGHPEMIITRLRPCTVIGPDADPAQMAQLTGKVIPVIHGYDPPIQLLHEEDMASALYWALKEDHPGIFNITSDEPRTIRQLVESRGGRALPLPTWIVWSIMALTWITRTSVFAPEWVDLSRYPIVASNEKAKQAGWKPRYSTPEAFLALLAAYQSGST